MTLPIIRNKDKKGVILTYSVKQKCGIITEHNTLREAKIMAFEELGVNE